MVNMVAHPLWPTFGSLASPANPIRPIYGAVMSTSPPSLSSPPMLLVGAAGCSTDCNEPGMCSLDALLAASI